MGRYQPAYKQFGERSILIEWPQEIHENILMEVLAFKKIIQESYIKQKVYIKSAYNSLLITYDFTIDKIYNEKSALKSLYEHLKSTEKPVSTLWKIPVCYEAEFAPDLECLSLDKNLSKDQIINLHSGLDYMVYFIGFLPGFLYLGGLDERLNFPRKSKPRLSVKKGSVGIGGHQTGVYPSDSPGGWNIIGNTPVHFFDVHKPRPCFAEAGDKIRFYPVSITDYKKIQARIENGSFEMEKELCDGRSA